MASNDRTDAKMLWTGAIATVVSVVVALLSLSVFERNTAPVSKPLGSSYAGIRSKGAIRIGYYVGAPLVMVEPNTKKMSGLFFDIVNRASEKLNLKPDWSTEVGYGEMIAGLNAEKYDIVGSGIWMNASRGKDANFTIPAYYDAVFAFSKEGDNRFDDDLSILNDPKYSVSTMDGELGAVIAAADFPKAKAVALPQNSDFSQLIENVINGKADVVFLALAPAKEYQAANPGRLHAVKTAKPLRLFPVTLLLPMGSYELKQALDAALTEMLNSGEIEVLLRKYEKAPHSFLRIASPVSGDAAALKP